MTKNTQKDRRIGRTKKMIKDTLLSLLQEQKINQISITELCNKADINRKTFYNHYPDIRNVLDEIEDDYINKYLSYLNKENILYDLADPYPFISRLTDEITQNTDLYLIISKADEYFYLKEKVKDILSKYLNNIAQQNPQIDHELFLFYIDFITAGMAAVYQQWLVSNNPMDKEKLSRLICEVVCNGSKIIIQNLTPNY